jgi:hypothetical protein
VATEPAVPYVPTMLTGSVIQQPMPRDPDPNELNPALKWPRSLAVYDLMTTEAQVISVLRAVTLPIMGTRWRIDPAGARDEVVQWVARDLGLSIVGTDDPPPRRTAGRFSWRKHLREALLSLRYGHMAFEQLYTFDPKDGGKAALVKLEARMPRRITAINVGTDGELISIEQNPAVVQGPDGSPLGATWIPAGVGKIVIPVRNLVYYVNEQEPGDWVGRSLLRAAYKNWLIKDDLLRTQALTLKRNGMGVPVYTGSDPNEDLARGWTIAQQLRSGETAGAAIPFGAMLHLQGVDGTLPDINPAIAYHDQQMARAVLAHFLNLGTQTGSWALGASFQDFFVMSLQSVAQDLCDTAQQHVVEDIVSINFGVDEPCPRIVFEPIGSQQPLTAASILALRQAGMIIPDRELEQYLRDQFGMPEKTVPSPENPAYDPGSTPAVPGKDVPADETDTNEPV